MAEQEPSILGQLVNNTPSPSFSAQQNTKWLQERDRIYNGSILPINPSVNSDVIGNIPTGPANPINPKTGSTENYARGVIDMINTNGQWANDPNSYSQPFSYGAGWRNGNYERYYSSPSFKKLGYFPGRDNEGVYNENTGFLGDFARMVPQMASLTVDAAIDMASEWGDWGVNNADTEMAEDFQKTMAIGMSTQGGVGGFVTNLGLNLAYPIGIMTEMFAEDLALAGITYLTGGVAAEATLPAMLARTARGTKKIAQSLTDINKIKENLKSSYDAVRSLKNVNNAREFMNAARLNKAADFINPFENTTKYIRNYNKLDGVSDWAKRARGAEALYRDARFINAVTGEAKLEAGFRKIEHTDELINDYYNEHGKLPTGEDLDKINQNAGDAGFYVGLTNMPMIFLTDKIVFDGMLKGSKYLRAPEAVGEEVLSTWYKQSGKNIIIENGVAKEAKTLSKEYLKTVFTPKGLASRSMKYLGKNFAQGIQETTQDIIQETFGDYYKHVYKDPTVASMAASLGTGLAGQMSAQGFETFLSGFFMGGLLGVTQKTLSGIIGVGYKTINPKGYGEWQTGVDNYINSFVNFYNEAKKEGRAQQFSSSLRGLDSALVRSKDLGNYADLVGINNDSVKEVIDAQDEQAFHAVIDFIRAGHGKHLNTLIDDFKGLSNEELAKAFGVDPKLDHAGTDARKRLDIFEKRINLAKSIWENSLRDIPNPFNYKKAFKEGDTITQGAYQDFEEYRKLAVFHFYSLQRAMDRQKSVYNAVINDSNLGNIPSSNISPLLSIVTMDDHISTLKAEIKALKEINPTEAKNKEKELELYTNYKQLLTEHLKNLDQVANLNLVSSEKKNGISHLSLQEAAAEVAKASKQKLQKAYKEIVKRFAQKNNVTVLDTSLDNSFSMVHDHYVLSNDITDIARIADSLTNPENMKELINRWLPEVRKAVQDEQLELAKQGLEDFFGKQALDTLTKELAKHGVVVPDDELIKLMLKPAQAIASVVDLTTNKRIPLTEGKGLEVKPIIDAWINEINAKINKEQAAKPSTTPQDDVVVTDVIPEVVPEGSRIKTDVPLAKYPAELADLKQKLATAFAAENERRKKEGDDEISELTFLEGPIANDIIDEYYEAKEKKPAPAAAPVTPTPTPAPTPTPVSDIEAKKADIERRRQQAIVDAFSTPISFEDFIEAWKNGVPTVKGSPLVDQSFTNILVNGKVYEYRYDDKQRKGKFYPVVPSSAIDAQSTERVEWLEKQALTFDNLKGKNIRRDLYQYNKIVASSLTGRTLVEIIKGSRMSYLLDEINAKYDAELATLEGETKPVTQKVSLNIAKPYRGKVIYVSPGAGKTTLVSKYNNLVDGDDLIAAHMKAAGLNIEEGETVGQAAYRHFRTSPDKMERVYLEVGMAMQNLADLGITILTGSNRFISVADAVIITEGEALDKRLEGNLKGGTPVETFRETEQRRLREPGKTGRIVTKMTSQQTLEDILTEKNKPKDLFDPIAVINNANSLSELKTAWEQVTAHHINSGVTIPSEIDVMYQNKLKSLTVDVTAKTVEVGSQLKVKTTVRSTGNDNFIELFAGTVIEVVSKNSKGVYVTRVNELPGPKGKREIYLTNNRFDAMGAVLYDPASDDGAIPQPDSENEKVAKTNKETPKGDNKERINRIRNRKGPPEDPEANPC